jgi:5-methylcytosine-specific restriction endonuclease McrA
MWNIKDRIDDEIFIDVCENSKSMAEACSKLGLHFNSFKKRAKELNCYKPNQPGVGIIKKGQGIPLSEILEGKHPQYQTYKLKNRLIKEGIKDNCCEVCGIKDWNNIQLNMELDHIDGDRTNHKIDNLRIICPNCHSQTDTYRSKNRVPREKSLE